MSNIPYEKITDEIIKALEKGKIPWQRPWDQIGGLPTSYSTGKVYRGLNLLILSSAGYASRWWLTFNQVRKNGGHVIPGEKGTTICFWKFFTIGPKDVDDAALVDDDDIKRIPMLRYYTVFNAQQTTGMNFVEDQVEIKEKSEDDLLTNPLAENILEAWDKHCPILYKYDKAFYSPTEDYIGLPNQQQFHSNSDLYCTAFHEIIHSTGHQSRLARDMGQMKEEYAKEELIAEMGASFLCCHCGIDNIRQNTVAYIQGWIKSLQNDPRMVVSAASKAEKASKFVLELVEPKEEETQEQDNECNGT